MRHGLPNRRVVLIGAAALSCQLDMRWRRTNDIDLTAVGDPAELAMELATLGWVRDSRLEYRWTSPNGIRVDVLPATFELLAERRLVFAETGQVMNLTGFDLAFDHVRKLEVEPGCFVDVATIPVVVILKMAAWLDRPSDRERDLEDVAHVLDEYLSSDDLRRWSDEMIDADVQYEEQSAFALGRDIAAIAREDHGALIETFLRVVGDESRPSFARFARCFPGADREATCRRRLEAVRSGRG
jgi:predicted nucleotidyltransferase